MDDLYFSLHGYGQDCLFNNIKARVLFAESCKERYVNTYAIVKSKYCKRGIMSSKNMGKLIWLNS